MLLKKHTTLSSFLSVPDLREKNTFKPKTSAQVLTSVENVMAEKEKEKEEREALRKERLKKKRKNDSLKVSLQMCPYNVADIHGHNREALSCKTIHMTGVMKGTKVQTQLHVHVSMAIPKSLPTSNSRMHRK